MKGLRVSCLSLGLVLVAGPSRHAPPLIVHEWGTITTRHLPNGTPEGRLNRIAPSEVLPPFVHKYEPPPTQHDSDKLLTKSPLTPGRPDVTMRLETPVLYFYPPSGSGALRPFDVSVSFRGGVVNEFYPAAVASVEVDADRVNAKMQAGLIQSWDGAVLNNYVVGSLRWRGLSLKDRVRLPETGSHVWLAPRRVRSSGVVTSSGEGERYLFYRGVAHLDAVVQTELSDAEVRLRAPARLQWLRQQSMTIADLWLVSIRADGRAAFRDQKQTVIAKEGASRQLARIPLFSDNDYSTSGLADLRRSMKQALVTAGLFADEADAMLETWKDAYFGSPGLRVFYIVPGEWTSYFLPLQISVPNVLTRVLVGRIDLVEHVGIVGGFFPARRAASLPVVQALR